MTGETQEPTPTDAEAIALQPVSSSLSLPARLEAILYLKGRAMTQGELAEIAGASRDEVEVGLITLMADYAHRDTALEIRQEGKRYSLQLRDGLGDLVQNLLPVDLSTAALRTLATIAERSRPPRGGISPRKTFRYGSVMALTVESTGLPQSRLGNQLSSTRTNNTSV